MPDRARPQVQINDAAGRSIASAEIDEVNPGVARTSLHVEAGHLPAGSRTKLVDAVLDDPDVSSHPQVKMAFPLGDTEILDRVRERCDTIEARAAGSTCLVDADLPDSHAVPGDRSDVGPSRDNR
jgi:hypothetical protein